MVGAEGQGKENIMIFLFGSNLALQFFYISDYIHTVQLAHTKNVRLSTCILPDNEIIFIYSPMTDINAEILGSLYNLENQI